MTIEIKSYALRKLGLLLVISSAVFGFSPMGNSLAASSDWQDIGGGKARMVAVLSPDDGKISGTIEIKLNKGWKTYWRSPGNNGIPPQLSFSGSTGYLHSRVQLPAPHIIKVDDTEVVGYKNNVNFVFDGSMLSSSPKNKIHLDIFLGVCEQICIPVQASFEIPLTELNRSDPLGSGLVEFAQQELPQKPGYFSNIEHISVEDNQLRISAKIPAEAGNDTRLFVEGPPQWRLAPASLFEVSAKGTATFLLDLSQVPKDADIAAEELRYTLVAGNHSVEEWRRAK